MKDIVKPIIDQSDLEESCLRAFGRVFEEAGRMYARRMGATTYKKEFGTIKIDSLWEYQGTIYNLEFKTNINLDKGKSRETRAEFYDKAKAAEHAFRNGKPQVSAIVVFSKPTGEEARKIAKKPLKDVPMLGYLEFFKVFGVDITKDEYIQMIQRVWESEVRSYCGKRSYQGRIF